MLQRKKEKVKKDYKRWFALHNEGRYVGMLHHGIYLN